MKLKTSLFFCLMLVKGFTWWDSSHMVVAKIAEENLSPRAKKHCVSLIEVLAPFYPREADFASAATWMDEVSNSGFASWSWHGKSLPYDEGVLSKARKKAVFEKINADNGVKELRRAIDVLKAKNARKLEKAIMLRYVLHIVGDLHQPLHCTTRYSKEFPKGDRGGTRFMIKDELCPNLHALWDSALKRDYIWLKKPIDKDGEKYLEEFKKEVLAMFPKDKLKGANVTDFNVWVKESHEIGILAYKEIAPLSAPSAKYLEENRKLAYERIALAGYRLAKLLNEVFEGP